MKIGITALERFGQENYEKIKKSGFDCVDFGMSNTDAPIYTLPTAESDALILREKARAASVGLRICQVHGPWRYPPMDDTEENRSERFEKMSISIRATSLLGCKYWIVHPIMPFGTHDTEIGKEKETWELNVKFFRALLPIAKEHGVTICLENMPMLAFSLSKPEDILRLVEEINDESFMVCLDTGHVNVFKELSLGDETRRLGKYIKTLHVHDNRASLDMHLPPYFGKSDWEDFIRALGEIGYEGVFSLETEPSSALPEPLAEKFVSAYADLAKWMTKEL